MVQLHSNDTTVVPRVQLPAATPSPQQTPQRSKLICNPSKPIVPHNKNSTIHISALEENSISYMTNINDILDPTTGDLLEPRQPLKTSQPKLWIDVAFNELSRLAQGSNNRTIKGTNKIYFISPNQKPTGKKGTYARFFVSYRPQK